MSLIDPRYNYRFKNPSGNLAPMIGLPDVHEMLLRAAGRLNSNAEHSLTLLPSFVIVPRHGYGTDDNRRGDAVRLVGISLLRLHNLHAFYNTIQSLSSQKG